jgi:hypothetical protein
MNTPIKNTELTTQIPITKFYARTENIVPHNDTYQINIKKRNAVFDSNKLTDYQNKKSRTNEVSNSKNVKVWNPYSEPHTIKLTLPNPPHNITKTAILHRHYTIKKEGINEDNFERHRKWLTLKVKNHNNFAKTSSRNTITFYAENEHSFTVPRYYGLARWGMVHENNDKTILGDKINVEFIGTLVSKQKYVCDIALSHAKEKNLISGGILKCPCVFGKTICAIYIVCKYGRKALITSGKTSHIEDTEEDIEKFAPTMKVGIWQGSNRPDNNCDIILATKQSLLTMTNKDCKQWMDTIGLWIDDEMHHEAAPTFRKLCNLIPARIRIGLSATPKRKDGLEEALFWNFGPILVTIENNYDEVLINMIKYTKTIINKTKNINLNKWDSKSFCIFLPQYNRYEIHLQIFE